MGQKVNPHGLRVGVIKDWDSRWFAKKASFGDTLVEDYNLRKTLKKQLYLAGVPKIEIERDASKVRIHIHCSKPGMVIGKGGAEIEKLRLQCEKQLKKPVVINIVEVKQPDLNAQLVAENVAQQLEKRIAFRRAMKQCIGRSMKLGAKGIKIMVSGRLNGAEIARSEQYHDGTIPLQTIARTSTTASRKPLRRTAESASRFGCTRARSSTRTAAAETARRKEDVRNVTSQESQIPQSAQRPSHRQGIPRQ